MCHIIFEASVYFTQSFQSCVYYSRAASIRRNTVCQIIVEHCEMWSLCTQVICPHIFLKTNLKKWSIIAPRKCLSCCRFEQTAKIQASELPTSSMKHTHLSHSLYYGTRLINPLYTKFMIFPSPWHLFSPCHIPWLPCYQYFISYLIVYVF